MNYFKFKDALIKKDAVQDGYKYTVTIDGKDIAAGSIQGLVNVLNEKYKLPKTDILNQLFKDDIKYAGFDPFTYSGQIKAINQVNFIPEYLPLATICHFSAGSDHTIDPMPAYTSLQELLDDHWAYMGYDGTLHCNANNATLYVFDQQRYNFKDVYELSENYYFHNIHIGDDTQYKEVVMRTLAAPKTTLSRSTGLSTEAGNWSATTIRQSISQTDPMTYYIEKTPGAQDIVNVMEQWDGKIIVWDGVDGAYMPGLDDLHEEPAFIPDTTGISQTFSSSQFCVPTQKVYLGKRYKLHLVHIQHMIQLQHITAHPIYAAAGAVFAFEPVD